MPATLPSKGGAAFEQKATLTAIADLYKNEAYIADEIAVRVLVGSQFFDRTKFNPNESYRTPSDKVGRTSRPNTIEYSSTLETEKCEDHALDTPVPNIDIENAAMLPNIDPLGQATEQNMDAVLLNREKRVADLVMTAANYDAGLTQTLAGTAQFSDYTNSDPINVIVDSANTMRLSPNAMALDKHTFSTVRRHPKIINAITGQAGVVNGMARREALEDFFGFRILIGDSWFNSAKDGQVAVLDRVWGNGIALLRLPTGTPSITGNQPVFCLTGQWGGRFSGIIPDPHMGARGGQWVRSGESVTEFVVSNLAGYLIVDAVA